MCEAGRVSGGSAKGSGRACRSGLIVYSTMLAAEQLSDGTNLNLGLSVHDAATVSTPAWKPPITRMIHDLETAADVPCD